MSVCCDSCGWDSCAVFAVPVLPHTGRPGSVCRRCRDGLIDAWSAAFGVGATCADIDLAGGRVSVSAVRFGVARSAVLWLRSVGLDRLPVSGGVSGA